MVLRGTTANTQVRGFIAHYPIPTIFFFFLSSAFQSVAAHQIPPHRRITQDEAPSMMPIPAQNTNHHQGVGNNGGGNPLSGIALAGGAPFVQSQSKPASTASFTSAGTTVTGTVNTVSVGTSGGNRKKARLR